MDRSYCEQSESCRSAGVIYCTHKNHNNEEYCEPLALALHSCMQVFGRLEARTGVLSQVGSR